MNHFLRADEIDPAHSWELLAWCAAHGGTEFFIRRMSLVGLPAPNVGHADSVLAPYQLPPAIRPRAVVYDGQPDAELTDLWLLSTESIRVLRDLFPDGLFTPPSYDDGGWLEEPTVFRGERVLLGVVSHEGEAFMDIAESEAAELHSLGFRFHATGIWI